MHLGSKDREDDISSKALSPPIHRLPVELLLHCFFFAVNDTPEHVRCECRGSLTLSHVCQRWRDVASEAKELWTFVPLLSTQLARLHMQRSNPLPVTVQYIFSKVKTQRRYNHAFKWLLANELPRVRELVLAPSDWPIWQAQGREHHHRWDGSLLFKMMAPQIKALHLMDLSASVLPPFGKDELDRSATPSLCDLIIYSSKLPLQPIPILNSASLTTLTLDTCDNSFHCAATSAPWMPSLKHLVIHNEYDTMPPMTLEPFKLSGTLETLRICARSDTLLSFLRAAQLSLRTALHVAPVDAHTRSSSGRTFRLSSSPALPDLIRVTIARNIPIQELGKNYNYNYLSITDSGPDSTEIALSNNSSSLDPITSAQKMQPYFTCLKLGHNRREQNVDHFVETSFMALGIIARMPGFCTIDKLRVNLSFLESPSVFNDNAARNSFARSARYWADLGPLLPDITEITTTSTVLVHMLANESARTAGFFSALTLAVISGYLPLNKKTLVMAKNLRNGIRFARYELLASLPDHCLPFDDDLD